MQWVIGQSYRKKGERENVKQMALQSLKYKARYRSEMWPFLISYLGVIQACLSMVRCLCLCFFFKIPVNSIPSHKCLYCSVYSLQPWSLGGQITSSYFHLFSCDFLFCSSLTQRLCCHTLLWKRLMVGFHVITSVSEKCLNVFHS